MMSSSSFSTARRTLLVAAAGLLLATLPAGAANFTIDPVHSSAIFKVQHFGAANFYGVFRDISGSLAYDADDPAGLSIQVTLKADSVDTRYERRDTHVKSPDFLSAAEFPTITFVSTSVEPAGDGVYTVTGNLTLRGVTKQIQVTARRTGDSKHPQSGKRLVGFESRFTVDRTDYGVSFMAGPVSQDVEFLIAVEADGE
jgi:polyisoprenoid-binding protein YceI